MNVFESLSGIYAEIDGFYMDQGLQQSKNGDDETEAVIAGKRKLNDHAYFLFGSWGELCDAAQNAQKFYTAFFNIVSPFMH